MRKFVLAALLALACLGVSPSSEAQQGRAPFMCGADNIAATLTQLTGCAVLTGNAPSQRYVITTIVAQSTTTTGGTFALQSGTGTNCGTTTTKILPVSVTTARMSAPASTAPSNVIHFNPGVPLLPGHALCVLGVATNTTAISVYGYIDN